MKTREHSSRMRTGHSPTIHAPVASHQMSAEVGVGPVQSNSQVNKFKLVSSLGHQMSLSGKGAGAGPCPGVKVALPPQDMNEDIIFPQLRWQSVIIFITFL